MALRSSVTSEQASKLFNLALGLHIFAGKEVAHEFVNFEGSQRLCSFEVAQVAIAERKGNNGAFVQ